jgi:Mu-like prophage I protein
MVASPERPVQCYVNRGTEFGFSVLAFAAPQLPPANDVEGAPAAAPAAAPGDAPSPARAPTPQFKWIHVANTGTYKGHHQGEFTLTGDTFAELVRNFRANPKYGDPKFAAGVGPVVLDGKPYDGPNTSRIVQFDYEHASEMAPFEGDIPSGGAPAIGWALELDVRQGDDGRPQLWCLAKLGDRIRKQIDADEYDSVSIAWNPAGVDWISGKPIGAVLTSVAFTNHPFIRDLMPLAAANRAAGLGPAGSVQIRAQHVEAHASSPPNQGIAMTALTAELRSALCRLYQLNPEAADGSIIRAAENAATASNDLAGLLKALGMTAAADAIGALPDLMGARGKLSDLLAQFDALMRADASADTEVETQDVAAAFSSRRYTDGSLVHSLAAHRGSLIDGEIRKLPEADRKDVGKVRAARAQGRALFLTHYGVATNPTHMHLTTSFVAGPGVQGSSTQYAPPGAVHAPIVQHQQLSQGGYHAPLPQGYPQPLQLSQQPLPQGGQAVDLSQFTGRNQTEQIMSMLSSSDPAFGKLDHGTQVSRASAWRRANGHLIVGAAA